MSGRTRTTCIAAVISDDEVEVAEARAGANLYRNGRLRWIGGANSGVDSLVAASDGTRLTLAEPPPYPPAPGDLIALREGCDKSFGTCTGRFGNGVNFRGEPHLPGIDLLTRYPGAA